MAKMKYVYRETLKDAFLKEQAFPILKHTNGAKVLKTELLEVGKLADETEYQIIRVILKPTEEKQ